MVIEELIEVPREGRCIEPMNLIRRKREEEKRRCVHHDTEDRAFWSKVIRGH